MLQKPMECYSNQGKVGSQRQPFAKKFWCIYAYIKFECIGKQALSLNDATAYAQNQVVPFLGRQAHQRRFQKMA